MSILRWAGWTGHLKVAPTYERLPRIHLGYGYDASNGHRGSRRASDRGRPCQSAADAGLYEIADALSRGVGADAESALAKDLRRIAAPVGGAVAGRGARALA